MANVVLSYDELSELLRKSNLPTIVTEGIEDYRFYRRIEDDLSDLGISLLPVGGRDMVLRLFDNRKYFEINDIGFLVDRDLWVFSGVPATYSHRKIIVTNGYSIENDLYRDGDLETFLDQSERELFSGELSEIVGWYSFCVDRLLSGQPAVISCHPNQILDINGKIDAVFAGSIGYNAVVEPLNGDVLKEYSKLLRGKTLVELLIRRLSAKGRMVRFGRQQLMEIGAARGGALSMSIATQIRALFEVRALSTTPAEMSV